MANGSSMGGPSLGTATIRVIANTTEFDYRLRRSLRNLSIAAVGVGTAMAGINFVGNSVKQAVELETVMGRIKTIMESPADESFLNADKIREVSNTLGKSATEVAEAAYLALSSGVQAKDVMDVITASGKNAVATNSDLQEAVNATTSALNAFGKGGLTATESNDILFRSLQFGKGSMQEFSRYISNAIPIVAQLTNGSEEAFAQLSAMGAASTLTGKTARVAFTGIKVAAQELSDATKGGGKIFKEVFGEDFQSYVGRTNDLAGAFVKFGKEVGGKNLTNIFGAKEGAAAIQQLLSLPEEQLKNILQQTQSSVGTVQTAFEKIEETAAFQIQKFKTQWTNLQSTLGATLLPVVVQGMKGLQAAMTAVEPWIRKLGDQFKIFASNVPGYIDFVKNKVLEFWDAVQPVVDAWADAWVENWPGIRDVLESLWELLQSVGSVLADYVLPMVGAFLIAWFNFVTVVGPAITGVLQAIVDACTVVVDNIELIVAALIPLGAGAGIIALMTLSAQFGSLAAAAKFGAWAIKYHLVVALGTLRSALMASTAATWAGSIANTAFWTTLMGPIGLIVAGIAAVIAAVVVLYLKFEWFREAVDTILTFLVKGFINVGQAIMNIMLAAVDVIVSGAAKALGWIPGIGPKLKAANAEFDRFAKDANAALNSIQDSVNVNLNVKTNIIPPGGSAPRPIQGPGLGYHGEEDTVKYINEKAKFMGGDAAKDWLKGLGDGLKGTGGSYGGGGGGGGGGSSAKSQIKNAIEALWKSIKDFSKETGKRSLDDIRDTFKEFNEKAVDAGLKKLLPKIKKFRDRLVKLAKQRDALSVMYQGERKSLDEMRDALQNLKDEAKDYQQTMRDTVNSLGSVAQASSGIGTTFTGIRNQLRSAILVTKEFNANILKLRQLGLNEISLRQLMDAGPEAAGAAARTLAASGAAGVKEINNLQSQLTAAGNTLAQQGYDAFFKNGIAIANGLVAGLASQEKALIDKMNQIGKNMAKAFKKELGIKSPSKVGEYMGRMTGLGIDRGLERSIPGIEKTSNRVAGAMISFGPGSISVNGVSDPQAAHRAGIMTGAGITGTLERTLAAEMLGGNG